MDDKNVTMIKIRLDRSRQKVGPTESAVLLYDVEGKCYYETTIDAICSSVLRKVAAMFAEESGRISDALSAFEVRMSEMENEQSEFIADTSKVNAAIIDMVSRIAKGE